MAEPGPRDDRESRADDEQADFRRRLRRGAGRRLPLALGLGALLLSVAVAMIVLRARRAPRAFGAVANVPQSTEEETPDWLESGEDAEGGRGKRHKDENGQMGRRDATFQRFGLQGPQSDESPSMAREEAAASAHSAGIIGVLKASPGAWNAPSAYGRDSAPTDALGSLMGEQVGSNFGFGGLGLRGTGRGGSGSGEGTIGLGNIGTIGHGSGSGYGRGAGGIAHRDPEPLPAPDAAQTYGLPTDALSILAASARPVAARPTPRRLELPARGGMQALLAHYTSLDALRFQEPNGYFANTYLPGDPGIRGLLASLAGYDRARLPEAARGARLEAGAQRNRQPFDAPSHAALDLFLSASERGAAGERRVQLQVGLRATPRLSGRRPALNAGIVLDLRARLDADTAASVRALLAALAAAHEPGDRFALFCAGRGPALAAGPEAFRLGPLTVLAQQLLAAPPDAGTSLLDALHAAQASVRGSDDPETPLGSSTLIVITPGFPDAQLAGLTELAQASAIEGIPLSVFDLGARYEGEALSRLALAGQGSLRRVDSARDASEVVDRELSSVSRIVARALRLRIRLAPGVRLVEVLGAQRLGEPSAEQVRAAERSIDQRLSRNLGIARDRGEDEEGIQIVIPSFDAGDSHVVLVDVVAPGPGPLADVSVRYKDLVRLDNGVMKGSLALANRELPRGALEWNVVKNVIAYELARQLRAAGAALAAGAGERASSLLDAALALLSELERAPSGLGNDRELEADRALVAEYRALVAALADDDQRRFAADSLQAAALLKLQPRPAR
jgi:hypothetical protein